MLSSASKGSRCQEITDGIYHRTNGYVLYEAAVSLIGKNAEFRAIHEYYQTRREKPLKKMQSVVAVACKILRVFYTILKKGVDYDAGKMMSDIRRPEIKAA